MVSLSTYFFYTEYYKSLHLIFFFLYMHINTLKMEYLYEKLKYLYIPKPSRNLFEWLLFEGFLFLIAKNNE